MVFNWREARKVSKSLTVQYDKVLYLIEDSEFSRRAIVNTSMSGITRMDIKSSGLMAYHFPTPPMTSFLKSIRGPLWITNVWGGPWKWRSWSRPSGIITGRNPYHPETALLAGVKLPRRRNPAFPGSGRYVQCPGETSVTL
nr:transposase [Salmonella enterica subsp. enterica serovar Typhimurium]